ncbi:MAG: dihydrodipicolinate synthase family protein [Deltaproteobacteria bacterium]|nr:dihydrodipicolinate synthase family protein [Deltaproteobacteria bacterium]
MASDRVPFGSTFVALPTPFDARGDIDGSALDHLTDYVLARPFEGIAMLTEAAEDVLLSSDERLEILDRIAARVARKKRLLVGVSAASSAEAVTLVRRAASLGVNGLLVGPYRVPGLGYRELYRHIEKVGRAHEAGRIYLVVRPDNAVDHLSPEEVSTLAKHPRVSGAFVPGGTGEMFDRWSKRMRDREGDVLSGCSLTFATDAHHGATAVVCGVALIAADATKALIDAVRNKDSKSVTALSSRVHPAAELLGPPKVGEEAMGWRRLVARVSGRPLAPTAMRPIVSAALVKGALQLLGHPVQNVVRPPYESLSKAQVDNLRSVLKVSGLM